MARKNIDKNIDRDTVLSRCADQLIGLAIKNQLSIDELMTVMRRTRKAVLSNAKVK